MTEVLEAKFIDKEDKETFFPFVLVDSRDSRWSDIRLSFNNWDWFQEKYGTNTINDYYINGYGVQGLVLAARIKAGLEPYPDGLDPNSEGDTCYIIFEDLATAVETATLACNMLHSIVEIENMIAIARDNDLDD